MTPDPWCTAAVHGDTRRVYRAGCRCTAARAAEAADRRAYEARVLAGYVAEVDACGVRRRLQALAALGWPAYELAARLGVTHQCVEQWRSKATVVRTVTAGRVAALYDELAMLVGPSADTRRRALRYGWVPPLAWDDDDLDDPAASPYVGDELAAHRIPYDDVALLAEAGETWERVSERTGFPKNSIMTGLARNGMRDVSARISRNGEVNGEPRNQWSA